jgi:sporulation protein YlmC with PRC-barrel domain
MKKTLSTIAAAAVLMASTAIAPVFAQTAQPAPAAPAASSAPADSTTAVPAAPAAGMTATTDGNYLTEQAATQVSANDYIGKSIYNSENESIGNVNDLLFEENGGLVAAVVGVGGFLGIGEKDVALPISKLTLGRDAQNNNEVRLSTTETSEALKAAPEFKTIADVRAETDTSATSSTMTPAPGTPAAPAENGATTPSTAPKN